VPTAGRGTGNVSSNMKKKSSILKLVIFGLLLQGCNWRFDPSVPYPNLEVGEYWIDKFDQRGLQNAKIIADRLFCNTINISEGQNYLYCLSLNTGKVIWKIPVEAYASQSIELFGDEIYFSTYVGDIYKISVDGKVLWKTEFLSSYAGHNVNPQNGNLIVNSVVDGAYEFDSKTGEQIHHYRFKSKSGICHLTEPLFYQNQIIFGNVESNSVSGQEGFIGIEQASKTILWHCGLSKMVFRDKELGLFIINNYILTVDMSSTLHCIDAKTGKELWYKNIIDNGTNNNWVFLFKAEEDKLVYYKGATIALDIKTGNQVEYKENALHLEFQVTKEKEVYKIVIDDTIQIEGLEIKIEKE